MSDNIKLSLDEIIKNRKKANRKPTTSAKIVKSKSKKPSITITKSTSASSPLKVKKKEAKTTKKTSSTPTKLRITIKNDKPSSPSTSTTSTTSTEPKASKKALVGLKSGDKTLRMTIVNDKYKPSSGGTTSTTSVGGKLKRPALRTSITRSTDENGLGRISIYKKSGGGSGSDSDYRSNGRNSYDRNIHHNNNNYHHSPHHSPIFSSSNNGSGSYDNPRTHILASRNPNHNWSSGNSYHSGGSHTHYGSGGSDHFMQSKPQQLFTGARVGVSNLNHDVTPEDLNLIFQRVGEIKSLTINYDHSGRSNGTATVVYTSKSSADDAVRTYQNALLDGKPMVVHLL